MRVNTGHYISGAGHLTLIGWVLLGGVFSSDPPPFEVSEVSVISGAEFDAMMAAAQAPASVTQVAQPETPQVVPQTPVLDTTPDTTPDTPVQQPAPQPVETPPEETPPETVDETPPAPTEVADVPPELDQPVGDVAVLVPSLAPKSVPRPVARVAPTPVAQPDPDVRVDDVEQAAVAPDSTGETTDEPAEATAPQEATTEIATEATTAPKASSRPPGQRPAAPTRSASTQSNDTQSTDTPSTDTQSATDSTAAQVDPDDVSNALEAALAAPAGPPLSSGEREGLRVAVGKCWNYGSLSTDAQRTTVVVSVEMSVDAKPIIASIRLVSSQGGSDAAARNAFETARRAIIKCGARGYPLPAEKFDQWKVIEMAFNPEKMRNK